MRQPLFLYPSYSCVLFCATIKNYISSTSVVGACTWQARSRIGAICPFRESAAQYPAGRPRGDPYGAKRDIFCYNLKLYKTI